MAHFLGMDFLFTQREYFQSIQTDSQGRKILVNSNKLGVILAVKPVPPHLDKEWFKGKLRFPRTYLGISKIEERIKKLSMLVHLLTSHGIPTRRCAKSLYRLSLIWWKTSFENMRKHIKSLTLEVKKLVRHDSQPWSAPKSRLLDYPRFTGEKIHENGIITPLWSRTQPVREGKAALRRNQ